MVVAISPPDSFSASLLLWLWGAVSTLQYENVHRLRETCWSRLHSCDFLYETPGSTDRIPHFVKLPTLCAFCLLLALCLSPYFWNHSLQKPFLVTAESLQDLGACFSLTERFTCAPRCSKHPNGQLDGELIDGWTGYRISSAKLVSASSPLQCRHCTRHWNRRSTHDR